MSGIKSKYRVINILIILATAILFIYDYRYTNGIFLYTDVFHILIIVLTVLIVHIVKAGRLYLALYGSEISFFQYLKIYCKVTPVSVVFPFKVGEFFRMYVYGHQLRNYLKGVIIVLLDRFMDTIALVTMILFVWAFSGGYVTSFVYVLLVFLGFALLIYAVFPGVHKFWKKYLLKANATEKKLAALKMLDTLQLIYQEITSVSKGRGIILYFMSLLAWLVEIGSIAVLNGLSGTGKLNQKISEYLMSAMSSNQSTEFSQFVFISVILMVVIYVVLKIIELLEGKKNLR